MSDRTQVLDANGVNEHGVVMCECGNKPVHAWEPGEWCGDRVMPKPPAEKESAMPDRTQTLSDSLTREEIEALREFIGASTIETFRPLTDVDASADAKLKAALLSQTEHQGDETETERVARLAFIAGGEFMRDSIQRTRWGLVSNANVEALVKAALAYSKEAR